MTRNRIALGAALSILALVSACGSSSDGETSGTATTAPSSSSPTQQVPSNMDPSQLQAITECLDAAGLSIDLPTGGAPSGMPSGEPPTGEPTGEPPTGMPTGGPFGGDGENPFASAKVKKALEACGLEIPDMPAGGRQ